MTAIVQNPCEAGVGSLTADRRYNAAMTSEAPANQRDNFSLAQDARGIPDDGRKSMTVADFPRWADYQAATAWTGPRPASIFHRDERFLDDTKQSEFRREFRRNELYAPPDEDYFTKYFGTNYKRHADSRFRTFETVTAGTFIEKTPEPNICDIVDHNASHIPRGDPEKAPKPVSETHARFEPIDAAFYKLPLAQGKWTPCPMKGDDRLPRFSSTTPDVYRAPPADWERAKLAGTTENWARSNILRDDLGPLGLDDRQATVYRRAFVPLRAEPLPEDRKPKAVAARSRLTTFRLDDALPTNYHSTQDESFRPHYNVRRLPLSRNPHETSCVCLGADDPRTMADSASTTNYRNDFRPMPDDAKAAMPDMDQTRHNFEYGDRQLVTRYYEPTSQYEHRPFRSLARRRQQIKAPTTSSVPLDYYGPEVMLDGTVYQRTFRPHGMCRMRLDEELMAENQRSHIRDGCGEVSMTTENSENFTPKRVEIRQVADSSFLQRSHVPLGTFSI